MKSLFFCILLFVCFGQIQLAAAAGSGNPFAGKKVGLFVSTKSFGFTEEYYQAFGAFVRDADSLELSKEELRQAMAVKIGHFYAAQLQAQLGADSVFFINEQVGLAKSFIADYKDKKLSVNDYADKWPVAPDYILTLDEWNWTTESKRVVATVSNRLVPLEKKAKRAALELAVYNAATGRETARILHNFEEETPIREADYLRPASGERAGGKLALRLLNEGLFLLFAAMTY